jgi:hypothetical protein
MHAEANILTRTKSTGRTDAHRPVMPLMDAAGSLFPSREIHPTTVLLGPGFL